MKPTKNRKTDVKMEAFLPQLGPWIFSDSFIDLVDKIKVRHKISPDKETSFNNIISDLFLQKIPLATLPQIIMTALFVDKKQAQDMALDIVGYLVLPVALFFDENPFVVFRAWGGKEEDYKPPQSLVAIYNQIDQIEEEIEAEEYLQSILTETDDMQEPAEASPQPQTPPQNTDKLLANYKVTTFDWNKIKQTAQRFYKITDRSKLLQQLHQAINKRDGVKIIAALLILAKRGELDEIFIIDKKIKDIFAKHLRQKFSDKLANHFLNNLKDPVYISYFLQHLFKDILKLSENESAVIAVKLANELKKAGDKEYLSIAYGDLADGKFKWKTIARDGDKLILE